MPNEHVTAESTANNENSNKETKEFPENEYTLLKHELRDLKDCQVRVLTFSIIGTGLILGFIGEYASKLHGSSMWLLPLVVLLPSWWIFFDKATIIARIVGYLRVIENSNQYPRLTNTPF